VREDPACAELGRLREVAVNDGDGLRKGKNEKLKITHSKTWTTIFMVLSSSPRTRES
jgi:hypothetical protein